MEQKTTLLNKLKQEVTSNLEKVGLSKDNKVELRKDTLKTGIIQFYFSPSWYHGELPFYRLMFDIVKSFYEREGFSVNKGELNDEDLLEYLIVINPQDRNETYIITTGSGDYKGSFGVAIERLSSRRKTNQLDLFKN